MSKGERETWNQAIAYATALLLRVFDEPGMAKEIWLTSGATLAGVDDYDAKPIRKAKRTGW